MVVVRGERNLLQIVAAGRGGSRDAHLLDGGQQEADEDGVNVNHHEQLDQSEPGGAVPTEDNETTSSTRKWTLKKDALFRRHKFAAWATWPHCKRAAQCGGRPCT